MHRLTLLLALVFLAFQSLSAAEPGQSFPLWDGKETVAEYAKRAGLEPTKTLDLGGGVKLEMVLVPAGKFLMGVPETDNSYIEELRQHKVTLTKPYYMGKFEVTQDQYQQIMGVNPSKSKGHDQPVEMASWNAVQEFCKKAGEKTGLAIRLPTGAEWEHACRAGTTTRFCSGDTKADLEKVAWCDKKGGDKPQPVGKKAPNAWGLYDMHGNIGEWVADNHVDYGAEAVIDPQAPHTDDGRIIRGGAFYATDLPCSSFMIGTWKAGLGDSGTGFRVAADVPPKAP